MVRLCKCVLHDKQTSFIVRFHFTHFGRKNMNSNLQTGLIVVGGFVLLKLIFGSKIDRKADIKQLMKEGGIIIDVRTPGEFKGRRIKEAINIPVNRLSLDAPKKIKDKSKPVIVYCHSGARSGAAKKILLKAGFTNVINAGSLHRMFFILGQ